MIKQAVPTATEAALVRSICRESFYAFVQEFWHVVVPETPVWNWHIKYLCDEFQKDAERVFLGLPKIHDTICNISPGTTKSTILSVMAHPWVQCRMPTARSLCGSHTQQLTFELSRKARMVERSDMYKMAFPEIQPAPDQQTKSLFMNTQGGGRMACTVGGMSPMGFHAHFQIVDDPIDPQAAISEDEIASANHWMDEVIPSRKVNKEVTIMWLIMQRLHQIDPTGHLLGKGKENIRHINLPAEKDVRVKPAHLRRLYVDGLMDPIRLSRSMLDEARIDLGEYGYAGQYRQNPVPRGGGTFKTTYIEIDTPPHLVAKEWIALVRYWDKAGTLRGGAYTVGLLMGKWRSQTAPEDGSEDQWWILDVVRGQWDASEREATIVQTAKIDGTRVTVGVEQEPGSGGKESAEATAARLVGYRVRIDRPTGDKQARADTWASLVNARRFKMRRSEWNHAFIDELKYFPKGQYMDQVDAGSGAFALCYKPHRRVGSMFGGRR